MKSSVPTARPYDIGCQPIASVTAEAVIQDGMGNTFLIFIASAPQRDHDERKGEETVAVVECKGCVATKLGYPNDEGLPEHPLYPVFESIDASVIVVEGSPWLLEIQAQLERSARRIRQGEPLAPPPAFGLRHFIVLLKESAFECIAESLEVVHYANSIQEGRRFALDRLEG